MGSEPGNDSGLGIAPPADDTLGRKVFEARLEARLLGGAPSLPRVDRFVLERMLGAGGMGTVWLAHNEALDRRVALKLVRRGNTFAGERMRLREARGLARIAHPNVIGVYDVGEHDGRVWLAMEYVPGRTLRECADELDRDGALAHWIAAGRGLAAIHAVRLVHRDVKPDNILLGDDGRVRVIDLGLVREAGPPAATRLADADASAQAPDVVMTPGFVGTRTYAAPEQLRGESVDERADQYSYAVSILESLRAARLPPGREQEPLPAGVLAVLARARQVDPAQRFASMTELVDALALAARHSRSWRGTRVVGAGLAILAAIALARVWSTSAEAPDPARAECLARAAPPCAARASEALEIVVSCADPACDALQIDPAATLLSGHRHPFDIDVDNRTAGPVELRWFSADARRNGGDALSPGRHPLRPHWTAADTPICVDIIDARARIRSITVDRAVACE